MHRELFARSVETWFMVARRPLPWRKDRTPYSVWVSEVMLQQTQASVVIPYFYRWMRAFPSIPHLARSSLDQVFKIWEGLGYYARARHLHEGARELMAKYGGRFPRGKAEEIRKIKGIGPYTAAAIVNFAFEERAAAVDGNVLRVVARHEGIEDPVDVITTVRMVEQRVLSLLPREKPWITMEGLIELGALLCRKNPQCDPCPIRRSCQAFLLRKTSYLPVKSRERRACFRLRRLVAVVYTEDSLLLRRGEKGRAMADLWEFPYFEVGEDHSITPEKALAIVQRDFPFPLEQQEELPRVTHTFTHHRALLIPYSWKANCSEACSPYQWVPFQHLPFCFFSSGHRRILHSFYARSQRGCALSKGRTIPGPSQGV